MVRDAIESRFGRYMDEMLGYVRDELVGDSLNPVRHQKMNKIETAMYRQRDIALDCAEDIADDTTNPYSRHTGRFLQTNPFLQHYNGYRERDMADDLTDHFKEVATDLAPLLETDTDSFADAMQQAYPNRADAETVLEKNFGYVDTIFGYADGMDVKLGPFTVVDFSREIQPIIMQGKRRVEHCIQDDLDDIYD